MAYFYFDFNDESKQRYENLISSLIVQLSVSAQGEIYSDSLYELYSRSQGGRYQPSYDGLVRTLRSMLQLYQKTYIILDALDECMDREGLLKLLQEITKGSSEKAQVQVLATSRKEWDIENILDSLFPRKVSVDIQSNQVNDDIQLYISETLRHDTRLKKWPASVKDEISKKLADDASGM